MNEFLFWRRHPLVPLLFHEVKSLHPHSFQGNDFSTCILDGNIPTMFLQHLNTAPTAVNIHLHNVGYSSADILSAVLALQIY